MITKLLRRMTVCAQLILQEIVNSFENSPSFRIDEVIRNNSRYAKRSEMVDLNLQWTRSSQ
jgi:hypothetical protein